MSADYLKTKVKDVVKRSSNTSSVNSEKISHAMLNTFMIPLANYGFCLCITELMLYKCTPVSQEQLDKCTPVSHEQHHFTLSNSAAAKHSPNSALTLLVGRQEQHPACKN